MAATIIIINVTKKDNITYDPPLELSIGSQFIKTVEDRSGVTRIMAYDPHRATVAEYIVTQTVADILNAASNLISVTAITIDGTPSPGQLVINALDSIQDSSVETAGTNIRYNNGDMNSVIKREFVVSESMAAIKTLVDSALNPIDSSTFLSLPDTPGSYAAAPNYFVRVNAATNALEFVATSSISAFGFNGLTDGGGGTSFLADDGTYKAVAGGIYGASGNVDNGIIATLAGTFEFGGATSARVILNNPVLQLKTTGTASMIEVINAGSGNITTLTDPGGGKNDISFVLGATAGASALNTTGGAWTMNNDVRLDKSSVTTNFYTNNNGFGLGISGGNVTTPHVFIESLGEVGIGNATNTPAAMLHVKSDGTTNTDRLFQVEVKTGNVVVMRIDDDGKMGIFGATPVAQASAIGNAIGTDAGIIDQIRDAIKALGITA